MIIFIFRNYDEESIEESCEGGEEDCTSEYEDEDSGVDDSDC